MNIENSKILICGGSGSWGRELTKQLIPMNPKEIIIFSRGEISQVDMQRTFNNPLLKFVIGDIRDEYAVDKVMTGVDYVFQLAALKHVPICENFPYEAVKSNIIGIKNVIDVAIKNKIKKFIDVSSDKAVNPFNVYGMTKAVGERMTIQANQETKDTEFICIRGGNALGSNGSVVPFIIKQIREKNEVFVTNHDMTRFFLTLPQAVELLLIASDVGIGGEIYVMNMPSFYIHDLVEVLVTYYGDQNTKIKITEPREGEKVHEVLISEHELPMTHYVNKDYYVIYPSLITGRTYHHIWDQEGFKVPVTLTKELSSFDNLKDKNFLIELLKKGGWLQ
jgi:UDP-N-acetylglucosamine 4,6-dehydratase/5-epimerase